MSNYITKNSTTGNLEACMQRNNNSASTGVKNSYKYANEFKSFLAKSDPSSCRNKTNYQKTSELPEKKEKYVNSNQSKIAKILEPSETLESLEAEEQYVDLSASNISAIFEPLEILTDTHGIEVPIDQALPISKESQEKIFLSATSPFNKGSVEVSNLDSNNISKKPIDVRLHMSSSDTQIEIEDSSLKNYKNSAFSFAFKDEESPQNQLESFHSYETPGISELSNDDLNKNSILMKDSNIIQVNLVDKDKISTDRKSTEFRISDGLENDNILNKNTSQGEGGYNSSGDTDQQKSNVYIKSEDAKYQKSENSFKSSFVEKDDTEIFVDTALDAQNPINKDLNNPPANNARDIKFKSTMEEIAKSIQKKIDVVISSSKSSDLDLTFSKFDIQNLGMTILVESEGQKITRINIFSDDNSIMQMLKTESMLLVESLQKVQGAEKCNITFNQDYGSQMHESGDHRGSGHNKGHQDSRNSINKNEEPSVLNPSIYDDYLTMSDKEKQSIIVNRTV